MQAQAKDIHYHFLDECNRRLAFHGIPWISEVTQKTNVDGTTLFGKPIIRQADNTVQRKN